jgi:hypothetical protein
METKYNLFTPEKEKYIVGNIEYGGFGGMYARRKLIMQIAHAFGRIPIFKFASSYVYEDPFEEFLPNINTLKEKGFNEIKKFNFEESEDDVVFFDFGSYWNTEYMHKYQCWCPEGEEYLFYSGYMYNLLKLNKKYTSLVEESVNSIKQKYEIDDFDDCIALHLRRGDKITETSYLSDSYLFDFVEKLNLGNKLFVTSDELDYIYEIEQKYPNFEFIFDSEEKRYGNRTLSNVDLVVTNPSLKEQETLTFVKNVEILKKCKAVVGMHSAQMTKIAGSMNSFINNKNNLYLLNSTTNKIDVMGSSEQTS